MQLVFRTLNQARSAFVAINFSPNFFESYTLTSEIFPKCKVLLKVRTISCCHLLFIFCSNRVLLLLRSVCSRAWRSSGPSPRCRSARFAWTRPSLESSSSFCATWVRSFSPRAPPLHTYLACSLSVSPAPGIKKTYRLTFEECEALQAVYSKDNCPNKITSRPRYGRPRAL